MRKVAISLESHETFVQKKRRRDRHAILTLALVFAVIAILFYAVGQASEPVKYETYTVQHGDRLWTIAQRYYPHEDTRISVDAIQKANGMKQADIEPGQQLQIPVTSRDGYRELKMEATAYCLRGNRTKCGTWPATRKTVAVDPDVIPLGTELVIDGEPGYVAEDTGKLIKGNKMDIYMNDRDAALQFGRQMVTVRLEADANAS